jgi:hypothetical protein
MILVKSARLAYIIHGMYACVLCCPPNTDHFFEKRGLLAAVNPLGCRIRDPNVVEPMIVVRILELSMASLQ